MSVTLKAIDGALEMLGGLILLFVSPASINSMVRTLTQHALSKNPHNFVATHLVHAANGLTRGSSLYAAIYLLSHGAAKVVVVVAVLRGKLWAYPAMIVVLGAFILYQLYQLADDLTIGLSLLTIFDAFIVWLTWREWRQHRRQAPAGVAPAIGAQR